MSTQPSPADPIALVEPSLAYRQRFAEERLRMAIGLGKLVAAIEHVGSTAIPGIKTKPIVDVLIGLRAPPLDAAIPKLAELGYEHFPDSGGPDRLFFKRRDGQVFHAHVVLFDEAEWRRHVIFRDWLNVRPDRAREYEALKVDLAARFADDRAAYTERKAEFVEQALAEAAQFPALRLLRR